MASLEAIKYARGSLELLDQRRLPVETAFTTIACVQDAWTAIRDMVVRGAPAIAIAAALSLAADLVKQGAGKQFSTAANAAEYVQQQLAYLVTSRPTAVNLAIAANAITEVAKQAAAVADASAADVVERVVSACESMQKDDVAANRAMGKHGVEAVVAALEARGRPSRRVRVLTHCNTGSLATAAYGTALGVVRALHEAGLLEHVYCTETRPYNQGARLTAYELVHDGLPATLIVDSAAAALMAAGRVDVVVVGADRIAANGDTANKIGTFSVAVAAAHHNIPFFTAAPTTTLDPQLAHGGLIEIEQREATEITHFRGQRVTPEGIQVWNPSFDVTPASLLAGIITQCGVVPKQQGSFDVPAFLSRHGLLSNGAANGAYTSATTSDREACNGTDAGSPVANGASHPEASTSAGFQALDTDSVRAYLAARPALAARLGPPGSQQQWRVREVGDGNINFVYLVEGPAGGLCVKQGLPYVRCVGEGWPLTQERVRFEADALVEEARHAPAHVPELLHYDAQMALIVMQYLAPPHIILRKGLTEGRVYPHLADHVSTFLANTLFHTSLLALDSAAWRAALARFNNIDMCRLTEQVIFRDPYTDAPNNRHTSPFLDSPVVYLRGDIEAKVAANLMCAKFIGMPQALLHGDLHTGSLMVTQDTTFAIDPEFAFYGPMAFDVGKFIANMLLAFFASDGHATDADPRTKQRKWLLQTAADIWQGFHDKFLKLWNKSGVVGDAYPDVLFGKAVTNGPYALKMSQAAFMAELLRDSLAFGGAVMIRRIVGIAHVEDFEAIADPAVRAVCEGRALRLGRQLLVEPPGSMKEVLAAARDARQDGQAPVYRL